MIDQNSYSEAVAEELGLQSSAYAEDVTGEVSLTSSAYGEDVADAINNRPVGDYDLRVCQYNIGHFNMGTREAPTALISSDKSDGYPGSVARNYTVQLQRWKNRINGIGADILSMPEWNDNFGYNGGALVTTAASGIFNGYNLSVGAIELSGWWQNTLASKLPMSSAENIYLGSTNNLRAYLRAAKVVIKGVDIWVAATHLNWNNPGGTGGAAGSYASRQKEIKECVKWLQGKSHVILMGDFNTTGPVGIESGFEVGLDEFDPFINGFTEDGVTYQGGCTLANSRQRPLLTANATGSRPDQPKSYPYCYIDNIIVKGFTMSNVQVIDDGTITDHCAVVCDLTLADEGGAL